MAKYEEGVNGSQMGASGGTDVYKATGVKTLRRRRRDKMTPRPTPTDVAPPPPIYVNPNGVVGYSYKLTGFGLRNYYMRPLHEAWRIIWKPLNPQGRTWLNLAQQHAHAALQAGATKDAEGKTHYSVSDLPLGDGSLGECPAYLTQEDWRFVHVVVPPPLSPALSGAQVCALAWLGGAYVCFQIQPASVGAWDLKLTSSFLIRRGGYHVFVCLFNNKGATKTNHIYIPPASD